ncbi:MAG: chemotaxis protein CheW [Aliivibrio sp.]|uniref:chemotaxis protein CheW n=1 Tax=Aliivibrio sp. TaxID=1872443 RepID=UPI001A51891A|nr:chemotaxis protein CheW [Aliivibrio sp.]
MIIREKISGEQALDDYFSSLFDEGVIDAPDTVIQAEPAIAIEKKVVKINAIVQAQPKMQLVSETPIDAVFSEAPELTNVQQLLNQLKNVEPITQQDNEIAAKVEVIDLTEASVDEESTLDVTVDEIQDWVVESTPEIEVKANVIIEADVVTEIEPTVEVQPDSPLNWQKTEVGNHFQLLFFIVNGMTFAVQLAELGGIHEKKELSYLMGRPTWYLGMQTSNEAKYHVVDTAKWVMPEKLQDDKHQDAYRYMVLLGDSNWGLACNQLVGTETITNEQIRWRETAGKRPWLAGMVKEKMCALIHVEALVAMLNAGLDIKGMDCEQKG